MEELNRLVMEADALMALGRKPTDHWVAQMTALGRSLVSECQLKEKT